MHTPGPNLEVTWCSGLLQLCICSFTTQERRYGRDGHDPVSQVLSLYPGSLCTVAQHVDATCTYLMTQIPVWYAMFSTDADNISQAGQAVCLPWLTMLACIYMSSESLILIQSLSLSSLIIRPWTLPTRCSACTQAAHCTEV